MRADMTLLKKKYPPAYDELFNVLIFYVRVYSVRCFTPTTYKISSQRYSHYLPSGNLARIPNLAISQTEFGSPTSDCVLCSVSSISTDRNTHFRLKTLDFLVYSTSFQGPEIVPVNVSSPTPLCLSSGPQYLYLGML